MSPVAMRPVPYPYRAMLAVTNDVDEADWDEFTRLHAFMNGREMTPLGRALDLEIGDSFFFYATAAPAKKPTFSYFEGPGDRPAAWAPAMRQLIDAGFLDSLHSWGEFSVTGGFRREMAVRAATILAAHPGKVPVWINHGDRCNEQMAGRPGWNDPGAPHGHGDVMRDAGIRYAWTGSLTAVIGQDAGETIAERVTPARLVEDVLRPVKRALGRGPALVSFFGNRLMRRARSAPWLQVFQRYGFWDKPAATDLGAVISPAMLDRLEARGGFASIYTHLFRRPAGMPFDRVDWSPLAELSRRHHAGRIKVTTTSRLLRYVEAKATASWTARESGGAVEIAIAPSIARDALQGLTFYVPDASRATVAVGGERLDVERNDPDHTGRPSISLGWQPLKYPLAAAAGIGRPA